MCSKEPGTHSLVLTTLRGSAFQEPHPLPGTVSTALKSHRVGAGHRAAGLILEITQGGLSQPLSSSEAGLVPREGGGQSRGAAHSGKTGKGECPAERLPDWTRQDGVLRGGAKSQRWDYANQFQPEI